MQPHAGSKLSSVQPSGFEADQQLAKENVTHLHDEWHSEIAVRSFDSVVVSAWRMRQQHAACL